MKSMKHVADTVAAAINPAEISADAAALDVARTLVVVLEARQQLGLPIGSGMPAIDRLARAVALSVEVRQELVRAHRQIDMVGRDIGVKMEEFGKDVPPTAQSDTPVMAGA
ncbi:hypothetical protein [Sphingomonas sp. DC2300-3]|uniref:hypothetical protein n=1 Tax=unclassified Sphingomonas TaxID=196159 RepID=UPI003CF2AEAB